MKGYLLHFLVYILAMSGLISAALLVYKKVMTGALNSKSGKTLKIEETLNINPRKSLMIVKAGDERFLIASDVDKTTLISKLESGVSLNLEKKSLKRFEEIDYIPPIEPKTDTQNISQNIDKKEKHSIHLDVINSHNPDMTVLRQRRNLLRGQRRTSEIEVGQTKDHGFSTMKEMAAKVNEI